MKVGNQFAILFFSIIFYFIFIELSFYLHLSQMNLSYFIQQLNLNLFSKKIGNWILLFVYFFLFFGFLDFIYERFFIKKYHILGYIGVSFLMYVLLFFIIDLKQHQWPILKIESYLSFFTIFSFVVIFNLYSFYYLDFIHAKKEKNQSLPEPIHSIFD